MTNVRQQSVVGGVVRSVLVNPGTLVVGVRRSVLVNPGTLVGGMDITPDTGPPIYKYSYSVYQWKDYRILGTNNHLSLETKNYVVEQISHLSWL